MASAGVFHPNNMAEFGFSGKKPSGILIIAKGIPFLVNEDVQLDKAQLGFRRREINLTAPETKRGLG